MTNLAGIVQDAQAARGEWLAVRQGELALTYDGAGAMRAARRPPCCARPGSGPATGWR